MQIYYELAKKPTDEPFVFQTVGVSLGSPADSTGLAVLETTRDEETRHVVRHLQRLEPGTAYAVVRAQVARVLEKLQEGTTVQIDRTAVGKAIADSFTWSQNSAYRYQLTAGELVELGSCDHRIPRQDAAAKLQMALQEQRLKIAALPLAEDLARELRTFNPRPPSGLPSDLSWRDRLSDDLTYALILALWGAESGCHLSPRDITVFKRDDRHWWL